MKAWLVKEKDEFCAEIVFAETRGKARAFAQHTDCCESADFIDIEVRREKSADKYYKEGKWRLDWYNPKDRIVLVKELDFRCEYVEPTLCEECSAKQFCDDYAEYLVEIGGESDA